MPQMTTKQQLEVEGVILAILLAHDSGQRQLYRSLLIRAKEVQRKQLIARGVGTIRRVQGKGSPYL